MKSLCTFLILLFADPLCAADLTVEVETRWNDRPLVLSDLSLKNAAGNELSVTRLAYLLSAAKLQKEDGKWIGAGNWQAFLDVEKKRTSFTLNGVPAAKYQALRFDVGLDAATDKSDPAKRPAGHALHPDVNGLHWSWRGGYVFLAIEGRWRQADGTEGGYSYHLAGEPCRGTVEVRAELDLRGAVKMTLVMDAAKIFSAAHRIDIKAADSTHSANDGGLAERMADNAVAAFSLRSIVPLVDPTPRPPTLAVTSPGGVKIVIPSHFPQVTWPADNALTPEGVALGRRLFNETKLSVNNTQACAACHKEEAGFTDPQRFSAGAQGQKGMRNSMPLANLAWKPSFFWDGRVSTLREQVLRPIQDPLEMNETLERVMEKLKEDKTYPAEFEKVFGSPGITPERLGLAMEQFLLTLIGGKSKLDRSLYGGASLTDEERRGFELFFTESDPGRGIRGADCFHCHGGAHFTNNSFANNGLDGDSDLKDEGRSKITGASGDRGKFMVPSLRNVAKTAPYMHDGRFATLEEVIEHYDHGAVRSATLDPNIAKHLSHDGLGLKPEEKKALAAFLRTLTEEK
ncbi:MAG TPA: MbnP family protein [Verrucomicrobiales bacterium]|nr:MbnP family protein [Verrucomicrobiales bacterium]